MRRNEFLAIQQSMKIKRLPFDWKRLNVVRHHNRHVSGETWKHYLCKCVMGKILYDANRNYFSEYEFPNKAVTDVLDVTTMTAIEFESKCTVKKEKKKSVNFINYLNTRVLNELFVIDLEQVPNDLNAMEQYLKNKIGV
jgi:hypothetical protein